MDTPVQQVTIGRTRCKRKECWHVALSLRSFSVTSSWSLWSLPALLRLEGLEVGWVDWVDGTPFLSGSGSETFSFSLLGLLGLLGSSTLCVAWDRFIETVSCCRVGSSSIEVPLTFWLFALSLPFAFAFALALAFAGLSACMTFVLGAGSGTGSSSACHSQHSSCLRSTFKLHSSWWFQPLWKIVKMGSSSPKDGMKIPKNIWVATTGHHWKDMEGLLIPASDSSPSSGFLYLFRSASISCPCLLKMSPSSSPGRLPDLYRIKSLDTAKAPKKSKALNFCTSFPAKDLSLSQIFSGARTFCGTCQSASSWLSWSSSSCTSKGEKHNA